MTPAGRDGERNPPAPALEASGLSVWRGRRLILDGVSLSIEPGQVVLVEGANGAGRSTLLSALAGLLPRHGRVVAAGRVIPPADPAAAVRAGLTVVPERRQLFPGLTVADNLLLGLYAARFRTVRRARRAPAVAAVYERFPVLAARRWQRAGTLSGGEQQMLALGRALVSRPAVLLLDEPFLGLAPAVAETIAEAVTALRSEGRALLVVDDHPTRAAALADRVVALADAQPAGRSGH